MGKNRFYALIRNILLSMAGLSSYPILHFRYRSELLCSIKKERRGSSLTLLYSLNLQVSVRRDEIPPSREFVVVVEPFDDGFGGAEGAAGQGHLLAVHGAGLGLGGLGDLGRQGQHVDVHVFVHVAVERKSMVQLRTV